jgi:hypothetical protein
MPLLSTAANQIAKPAIFANVVGKIFTQAATGSVSIGCGIFRSGQIERQCELFYRAAPHQESKRRFSATTTINATGCSVF